MPTSERIQIDAMLAYCVGMAKAGHATGRLTHFIEHVCGDAAIREFIKPTDGGPSFQAAILELMQETQYQLAALIDLGNKLRERFDKL